MKRYILPFFLLGLSAGYLHGMENPSKAETSYSDFKYCQKAVKPHRDPGYHKSDRPDPVVTRCPECGKEGLKDDFDATRHLRTEHNALYLGTQWDYSRSVWTIMYQVPVQQ